jgi:hypothetical protein
MSTLSTISLSSIVSDPGAIFVNASDSVHYRQSSGASCHARTDNYLPSSVAVNEKYINNGNDHPRIPMWVHPFASTSNCSVRTQAASVAHLAIPKHKNKGKVIHRRRRRHNKKQRKQDMLLEEHVLPVNVSSNLLSADDILNDIIVYDGGDAGNPPIIAPKNVSDINLFYIKYYSSPRRHVNVFYIKYYSSPRRHVLFHFTIQLIFIYR